MTNDNFLDTPFAKTLLADFAEIEAHCVSFNAKWGEFWNRNADHLGTILICHLILEYFMDQYLAVANPGITPPAQTRLTFSQKLALFGDSDRYMNWILPGVRRVNQIRNEIAHDIEADMSTFDLTPLRNVMKPWREALGEPVPDGISLVKDFSLFAANYMSSSVRSIEKYGEGLGIIAYQRWLQDAANPASHGGSE